MFSHSRPELKGTKGKRFGCKEVRALCLGLDGSGKTTLLYKLKLGEVVTTIPTIGFNVETLEFARDEVTMWDVGGQEKLRSLWRHYLQGTGVLVYAVDSSDTARFDEARDALLGLLRNSELDGVKLILVATKQDLPQAVAVEALRQRFKCDDDPAFTSRETIAVGTSIDDYSALVLAMTGAKSAPLRNQANDEPEEDPRSLTSHMLWRVLGSATHMLGLDYDSSLPATRFGATRSLPAEVIATIVAYLPLNDLLPEGFLSRRYATVYPQSAWLTSQAFLVASFSETVMRISTAAITKANFDEDFDVRSRLRPLCYLQVPRRYQALHALTMAALFVVLRHSQAPGGLADALRCKLSDLLNFAVKKTRPPVAYALRLSQVLDVSIAAANSTTSEWRLDGADEIDSDVVEYDDEPHGDGIDLTLDLENMFLLPVSSLIGDMRGNSQSIEAILTLFLPLLEEVAAGVEAYVSLPHALMSVAPTHASNATMPALRTLRVNGFPALLPLPPSIEGAIRSGLYRVLVVTEGKGGSEAIALSMALIDAALDIIRGRGKDETSRCRYVKMDVRFEVLPLVLTAALEGIAAGSSVREVRVTTTERTSLIELVEGEPTVPLLQRCKALVRDGGLTCDTPSRDTLRIRMRL